MGEVFVVTSKSGSTVAATREVDVVGEPPATEEDTGAAAGDGELGVEGNGDSGDDVLEVGELADSGSGNRDRSAFSSLRVDRSSNPWPSSGSSQSGMATVRNRAHVPIEPAPAPRSIASESDHPSNNVRQQSNERQRHSVRKRL